MADLEGTPGFLCLYRVPRSSYDAMFPVIILTKPVPVADDTYEVRYGDYQVYETPAARMLFHPGSWDDFELDTFTEIEISQADPKALPPNRVGHSETEVPCLGSLKIRIPPLAKCPAPGTWGVGCLASQT
jgi:hypothetical protein